MRHNDYQRTYCPLCFAPCIVVSESDGNGGMVITYTHEANWLDDGDALLLEQGSVCPNTSGAGGSGE